MTLTGLSHRCGYARRVTPVHCSPPHSHCLNIDTKQGLADTLLGQVLAVPALASSTPSTATMVPRGTPVPGPIPGPLHPGQHLRRALAPFPNLQGFPTSTLSSKCRRVSMLIWGTSSKKASPILKTSCVRARKRKLAGRSSLLIQPWSGPRLQGLLRRGGFLHSAAPDLVLVLKSTSVEWTASAWKWWLSTFCKQI